jgi:two-component system, sensor histidine kinase YesM
MNIKLSNLFKKSMAVKFFIVFLLLVVIPVIAISFYMNNIYINVLLKKISERYFQSVEETALTIEDEVRRMSLITSSIANNDEILKLVNSYSESNNQNKKFEYSKKIDSTLNFIFNYSNKIDSLIFFYKDKGYYDYKNYPVINEINIRNEKWYKESIENNGKTKVLSFIKNFTFNPNKIYLVSVVIGIPKTNYENNIDLVYMSFRLNYFDNLNYGKNIIDNEDIFILDENYKILLCTNKKDINKNITDLGFSNEYFEKENSYNIIKKNNNKFLLTSYSISKTNWKIVSIIDYKKITKEIDEYYNIEKIIFISIMILFFIFSIIFFINIINPIKKLTKKMKQVEKGNFDLEYETAGFDEVYNLNEAFNKMVKEIDNLTTAIKLKEKERLDAEIESLQYQINPHFMSNTLNSIRLMAMMAKTENIQNMTESLMKFMIEIFRNKGKLITIDNELNNLENYIYIMKIRFGDKFSIIYDIDKKIRDFYILKIIFQPIIENAIIHGISENNDKGIIKIKGFIETNNLIFEIIDNGRGIEIEKIKQIFTNNDKNINDGNIGIKNVDKRIKLYHGSDYGIFIESQLSKYTKVKFVLPIIINEAENYV